MDEFVKTRLILAARTGKLTEEQYAVYLKLLEEDPDFRDQVEWEGLLEKTLPVSMNAKLYAAADAYVFPVHRTFLQQYGYAIAASVTVLLVAGWLVFYFGLFHKAPVMVGSRMIEIYSGDERSDGQLSYSEGDMPAGELSLKWWKAEDQRDKINYRFCSDTLHLYFRESADTIAFNKTFRLLFSPKTQNYYLQSKDNRVELEICTPEPKTVIK